MNLIRTSPQHTNYGLYRPDQVRKSLEEGDALVSITGKPGLAALFHCNLLHASGKNLSATDRWQIYFCFNRVSNHPNNVDKSLPDYVRSQNWSIMEPVEDGAIIKADRIAA
ncbi:MAG: phytanoyl-CoA dioxygenase family protein [Alphaproteobacteria bacterium]